MALGKTHDLVNVTSLPFLTVSLLALDFKLSVATSFTLGWLFSTFVFGPDSDISIPRRLGPCRIFFFPYLKLFSHRKSSHYPVIGTLLRLFYLYSLFLILILIWQSIAPLPSSLIQAQDQLDASWGDFYQTPLLTPIGIGFSVGMLGADLMHLALDFLYSGLKKIKSVL